MEDDWDFDLELSPSERQKKRMEGFLEELFRVSTAYGIALRGSPAGLSFYDMDKRAVVGLGLTSWFRGAELSSYVAEDSILDEAWVSSL